MAILDFYCQSSYWQINWIYTPIDAYEQQRMVILDFYCQFILADQQFQISTFRVHIGRSTGISTPQRTSSHKEWQFQISTVRVHIGRSIGRSTLLYMHLVAKNGNVRFLLLELILADQQFQISTVTSYRQINWQISHHRCIQQQRMVILDFYCQFILADQLIYLPTQAEASSGQEWQFQISTVRFHIGRSTGRSTPHRHIQQQRMAILDFYCQSSYWQISNFRFLHVRVHIGRSTGISTPWERHLVAKNGNFRFLLLEFILADQLADLPPHRHIQQQRMGILDFYCQFILADQQFQISTVRVHIGRSTGISTPWERHLVTKNGNFRFLLLEFILADQLADLPTWEMHLVTTNGNFRFLLLVHIGRSTGISTPWERHLVAKNGNFRFLLLEFILADQLADLPPQTHLVAKNRFLCLVHIGKAILDFYCQSSIGRSTQFILASSGQEWQFQISTMLVHIGRSTGISTHLGEAS